LRSSFKEKRNLGTAPVAKPLNGFTKRRLDHDDFELIPSKIMNMVESKSLERDAGGKPVPIFLIQL
jgi:hypothetical protein